MSAKIKPSGVERFFDPCDIIVSKTDLKGRIIYANDVFIDISGYTEKELLGQPHNIIRHPDMPRCVFKLLWDTIESGEEILAYVLNMSKNGDHYWVFAHVTPTFSTSGDIIEHHSNRRVPRREALEKIKPIYAKLLAEEKRHKDRKEGLAASTKMLNETLGELGARYDQLMFIL